MPDDASFDDVVVTHAAKVKVKAKAFRYLDEPTIEAHVRDPPAVFYSDRESWLIPVDRPRPRRQQHEPPAERIVIVVKLGDDGAAVVVTQTGDHEHYAWEAYPEVETVGIEPEDVGEA